MFGYVGKNVDKIKFKKSLFLVYEKMLVIQFPYVKINSHRPFVQFFVVMELNDKSMISFFPYMKIV